MADGGELTAAAATGDLKVCFLKAAFLLYVDVNLNYTSIVKAILKKRPIFFSGGENHYRPRCWCEFVFPRGF